MGDAELDRQLRVELTAQYHAIYRSMLILDGWEPGTWMGDIVRRAAHRMKLSLIDGVTDYEGYLVQAAADRAVEKMVERRERIRTLLAK